MRATSLLLLVCVALLAQGSCTTFDGIEWVEPSAGGKGGKGGSGGKGGEGGTDGAGKGGSGGSGGALKQDGSTCEQAIDLTGKTLHSTVLTGAGKSKGTCGGDALAGSTCGNTPEQWFKYTAAEPMYLGVALSSGGSATFQDLCSSKSELRMFLYAKGSCEAPDELLCGSMFTLFDDLGYSPLHIKIAKAGTVYFAVDGRLSDQNQVSFNLSTEPLCSKDADCKILGRPLCDVSKGLCFECLSNADCKNPTLPVCAPQEGRCVECAASTDCKDPARPTCFFGYCEECGVDADCKDPKKPACDYKNICVECTVDTHCKEPGSICAYPKCAKKIDPACGAPAVAPSKGACVPAGKYPCNPVTNEGCSGGSACDREQDSFMCYPDSNTLKLCEACSDTSFCMPGATCFGPGTLCARFCCDDGDCGGGKCDKAALPLGEVGLCAK